MEYRWGELFDGRAHLYRAGRDFDMPPADFALLAERTARDHGLVAAVRVDGVFVAVQAAPPVLVPIVDGFLARIDEAVGLRQQGWTYQAIADHFGVAMMTARKHVLRRKGELSAP